MRPTEPIPKKLRLRSDFPLGHEEGACLPLRSTLGQCRACATACPVGALAVSVSGLELTEACTGCGQCVAACPTQALGLPEMEALEAAVSAPAAPMSVRFECRKVPVEAHKGPTEALPCLGALTPGHLLARAAAGIEVQVVDRAWCVDCTACPKGEGDSPPPAHAAAKAIAQALLWLEAVQGAPRPVLLAEPLPLELRPENIPPVLAEAPAMDRRRFFRSAVEKPAGRERSGGSPMGGDGRAAYPADARRPSPERERQRLALQALSEAHGQPVPVEFYPQLQADTRCCNRGMCVALCPTGALTAPSDGVTTHLQWSSERCIACGTCVRACPEGALALQAYGGRAGLHTLASHHEARCSACGDRFTPSLVQQDPAAPPVCPICAKSRHFVDDARRQLFGAPGVLN